MKINFKSIFGIKEAATKISPEIQEQLKYDEGVDFYYTNLINAIILFSLTSSELDKLAGPAFDPLFELESEIDAAFTPVCFETVFRNNAIDDSLKPELLAFKQATDDIPDNIWDWDCIESDPTWKIIRQKANELLDKLGIQDRTYNEDYITVYDGEGNILKKGKRVYR
ncbi:hypothetical protein IDJ77_19520 [Mucilaginibacter sp. ZT4R22]|uniref:Uncharacterized protein n=1 Tax=Mucilaginibacter pankratovii TaxID=2772110 RepID=A0ABR7WUM7_9SPHI|nr:hypothetical protein [Mucilaginibacter pankratovii]MBD1366012.1 hypothetical protein [Mucilaginibacter pankratovii]